MGNGTPPIFVRSCSDDCDFVTVLRARVAELEAEVERLCEDKRILVESETEEHDRAEKAEKERDEARAWAKNWETACEVKNKQLDEYDEKVAASEMVAIERSGCEAAMREMEIARGESRRMREERDEALRSCETWKRLARDADAVRQQTYEHALDEQSKVDALRDQLREAFARTEAMECRCEAACKLAEEDRIALLAAESSFVNAERRMKEAEEREAGLRKALATLRPLLARFTPRPHELDRAEEIVDTVLASTPTKEGK